MHIRETLLATYSVILLLQGYGCFCCLVNLWLLQLNQLCSVLFRNSNSRFQAAPMFVHLWSLVLKHDSPWISRSWLQQTQKHTSGFPKSWPDRWLFQACTKAQAMQPPVEKFRNHDWQELIPALPSAGCNGISSGRAWDVMWRTSLICLSVTTAELRVFFWQMLQTIVGQFRVC